MKKSVSMKIDSAKSSLLFDPFVTTTKTIDFPLFHADLVGK
jgi:hypothetical protein